MRCQTLKLRDGTTRKPTQAKNTDRGLKNSRAISIKTLYLKLKFNVLWNTRQGVCVKPIDGCRTITNEWFRLQAQQDKKVNSETIDVCLKL